MADSVSTSFIMYGAREAMSFGLTHIEKQVESLESAVLNNSGLAFDLAKTLVESVCRTVLNERSIGFEGKDDLPKLFKLVTGSIQFLPPAVSKESQVRKSIEKTLSGLNSVLQGICELRNQCGFSSHGSENSRPELESTQALLAAEAADAIVGFLYRIHQQDRFSAATRPLNFNDYQEFNQSVDDLHGTFQIYNIEFRASEILYKMEPDTYRIFLTEYGAEEN